MKDPRAILQAKFNDAVGGLKLAFIFFISGSVLVAPSFYYGEYEPWWVGVLRVIGGFLLLFTFLGLYEGIPEWWRYLRLKRNAACFIAEIEVEDKFKFIESVGGGGAVREWCYLVSAGKNYRLDHELSEQYNLVEPGAVVTVSAIDGPTKKEIVDLEIVKHVPAPQVLEAGAVKEKYASKVNIKGYEDNTIVYNKLFLIETLKFYLIVDQKPVKVNLREFKDAKLYAPYDLKKTTEQYGL